MQRLNHHHLYIFWLFGKTESVTKTAQELSIAQSAVTTQLRQLEESIGLGLIDRTHSRYPVVTPAGKRILEYADSIFETSRELINWASKGALPSQHTIRIGALSGLSRNLQFEFVGPYINDPQMKFNFITGDQEKLVSLLKNHEIDVILSSHNVRNEKGVQFYSHVLTSTPLVIVKNKLNPRKKLETLLSENGLFVPGSAFEAKPELDAFLKDRGFIQHIKGEIDDVALLRIMALRSGSVVALPRLGVNNDLKLGDIQILETIDEITQKFYAITRSKLVHHPEVDFLIQKMRS